MEMERFLVKFLLMKNFLAVCLDQKVSQECFNPLTQYFFWPQKDAWEEMKNFIDNNDWISEKEAIIILNRVTEVINFWEDFPEFKKEDVDNLKLKFSDCFFSSI